MSFWYIYDKDHKLIMMVLEVNNTFDERRMYLLKGKDQSSHDSTDSSVFTDTWAKDFHVSPFNSRKGTYSLKVKDPFDKQHYGPCTIDNVITLKSSQDHVKLVARVFSTTDAVLPAELSLLSAAGFVLKYGWIGFLTSPRIVYEAARLFFKRSLHVWFRPEIVNTSIGRAATVEEVYVLVNAPSKTTDQSQGYRNCIPDVPSRLGPSLLASGSLEIHSTVPHGSIRDSGNHEHR